MEMDKVLWCIWHGYNEYNADENVWIMVLDREKLRFTENEYFSEILKSFYKQKY